MGASLDDSRMVMLGMFIYIIRVCCGVIHIRPGSMSVLMFGIFVIFGMHAAGLIICVPCDITNINKIGMCLVGVVG